MAAETITTSASETNENGRVLDGLRAAVRGEVVGPADAAYDSERALWNGMIDRRPAAIVAVASAEDVAAVIRFAAGNGLVVTARGGGHGVAGSALTDGGLVVDLSRLTGIEVDPERRVARAGAGCRLGDLDARKGRYFIDFEMRTALAFRGDDGLPLLISAKCTHLGCTVASEVDDNGKILCPCHISYFDVRTGMPNPGAPAKTPLPHLEWVLVDPAGAVVARRTANGVEQLVAGAALDDCAVYLTRRGQEAV